MARRIARQLHERACRSLVGGVNSPVRAFAAVGGAPVVASKGAGPYLFDVDGNRYADYLMSWGALLMGHAPGAVVRAVAEAAARGASYGLSTKAEARFAEILKEAVPSVERLRLVSSGTEAVMSAVRLARGFTGRDKIVKFAGGYHGHSDGLLAKAGSGLATFGLPASAGVPASFAAETLVAEYNSLDSVRVLAERWSEDLAAVLVEPVAGNMGVVPPAVAFLQGLRDLCDRTGALLVFDEVITGFRVARGGAQAIYGVRPDLTVLGKIIGGGLPLAAFGGRAEVMERLAPLGDVYQAGTLSGNPLAVAAGIAVLESLGRADPYPGLEELGRSLEEGLLRAARSAGVAARVNRVGSMLTMFFTEAPVVDLRSAQESDARRFAAFFRAMLAKGVLLPPSPWESWFLSAAHGPDEVGLTVAAAEAALRDLPA